GGDAFTRSAQANHAGEMHKNTLLEAGISESLAVTADSGHALSQPAHVAPFGRFAAASNLKNAVAENVDDGVTRYLEKRKHPKWLPMAAGVAALVITVIGGALLFYLGPFASSETAPAAAAAPASTPSAARVYAPTNSVAAAKTATPSAAIAAGAATRPAEPATAKATKAPVQEAAQPKIPAQETEQITAPVHAKPAAKVPDMFVALNAHPVSAQRTSESAGAESAPSIGATGAGTDSSPLKGLVSSIAPPSPIGEVSTTRHAGSQIKPPQLVSSVLPVYPQIAQVAGVEGDVVVQASVDASGNVTAATVISGPQMLRTSAVEAVRRWKYQPAMLDDKPVATQMTIRMRFHR